MYNMSETQSSYVWNANDYSNIITIGASALASVLLVIFKSRCKTINLCCGLLSCNREVKDDESEEEQPPNNNEEIIPPNNNPPNP